MWSSGWELAVGEGWLSMAGLRLRSHGVLLQDGTERLPTFLRNPGSGAPRMTVNSRCQELVREFGSYRYHEPREHYPISEAPSDADNHAFKALCYWLYDRFGAVRPRSREDRIRFGLRGASGTERIRKTEELGFDGLRLAHACLLARLRTGSPRTNLEDERAEEGRERTGGGY